MPKTLRKIRRLAPRRALGGFTAIEIAMVATVIAIFALLVLPIFRNRVETAKIVAAQADLVSFMKAEQLAQADTGFYIRLEDLDNVEMTDQAATAVPTAGITVETPPFVFYADTPENARRLLTVGEWQGLGGVARNPKFKGPYVATQHYLPYSSFLPGGGASTMGSYIFHSQNGGLAYSAYYDFPTSTNGSGLYDSPQNRIPVDPWGNPYLFFPKTNFRTPGVAETSYQSSVIYSLGPDGLPGDPSVVAGNSPADYLKTRPSGLGDPKSDEAIYGLSVQF